MRSLGQLRISDIRADLAWGLRWGVGAGAAYAALATVSRILRGTRPFDRVDTTYPETIAFYLLGGVVTGVMLALVRSRVRSTLSAVGAGILVMFPIALVHRVVTRGVQDWGIGDLVVPLLAAVMLGGMGGLIVKATLMD